MEIKLLFMRSLQIFARHDSYATGTSYISGQKLEKGISVSLKFDL